MAEKRAQSLLLVDANHDLAKNDSRNVLRVCCLNFHFYIFCSIILVYKFSPLNWRKLRKIHRREKKIWLKSVHKACYSWMQIMTLQRTTRGTFCVYAV